MSDQSSGAPMRLALIGLLLALAAAMVLSAATLQTSLAWIVAVLAALALLGYAVVRNRPFWRDGAERADASLAAAQANALALGCAYAWGALVMLAGYYLTPLKWYHAYQYGGAMAILAFCWLRDARRLARPAPGFDASRLVRQIGLAATAQALAAGIGVAVLIGSGKLIHERTDWLANRVFIAGGLAVALISALTAATLRRVGRTAGS